MGHSTGLFFIRGDIVDYVKEIKKVGIITIFWNAFLSISKIVSGILVASSSLISDGIHSFSDILSTIVVMVGAKMSKKKEDKEHPFGHERMESIATLILAFLLVMTASFLIYNSIFDLIDFFNGKRKIYDSMVLLYIALGFCILSIIVKGIMYFWTKAKAKEIKSDALYADSIHHLTDSISSFASLFGILGLFLGDDFVIFDPIASMIIAMFILKVSFDIGKKSISEVVDTAAPEEFVNSVRKDIQAYPNVLTINSLKTRMFGKMVYVEVEIGVDGSLTVKEGHDIALGVHNMLEEKYKEIKHIMVHVDPIN